MAYFFTLPPINDLNTKQQNAIHFPLTIALKGGPGTGKSVVTLYRHIRNIDMKKYGHLVTYHIPLCRYLQIAAVTHKKTRQENSPFLNNITTTGSILKQLEGISNNYEIIFDEAQDLDKSKYEPFKKFKVSYAIDSEQSTNIHKDFLKKLEANLKSWFSINKEIVLDKNYRNTKQVIDLVRSIFPHKVIPHEIVNSGPKPELLYTSALNQITAIINLVQQKKGPKHNIAILYPTGIQVENMFTLLHDNAPDLIVSKYHSGIKYLKQIENIHITTFKSCKGLEFDTVIIPDFEKSVIKNGKLENENEIYVALTRTKTNLFLIDNRSKDDAAQPLSFLTTAINNNTIKISNDYK
jgi:superfamily I DNA/RNA helicase